MTGKTHVVVGLAIVASEPLIKLSFIEFYQSLSQHKVFPVSLGVQILAIVAAVWIGSLAPDIDQPGSTLSRDIGGPLGRTKFSALMGGLVLLYFSAHLPAIFATIPYIQAVIVIIGCLLMMMAVLKHRGLTHSLLGMTIAGAAIHWVLLTLARGISFVPGLIIPFLIGYGAHLAADSFTNSGVALLYLPFIEKTQKHWRWPLHIQTGAFMDTVVLRAVGIVLIFINVLHIIY